MFVQTAIQCVVSGGSLSEEQAHALAGEIMDGQATPAQIGALLAALRLRGESVDELVGVVQAVRERAAALPSSRDGLVDTCGTGGDGQGTFNVSTVCAFVAAAAGCAVAKHGNRAISSACGSADCLEALGVRPDLPPPRVAQCIETAGLGFLFAPLFHAALRQTAAVRRELGFRSLFNIVGPLANPARPARQLIGVFERRLTSLVASALGRLGCKHVLIVHGEDGGDEISLSAATHVCELHDGETREFVIHPEDFGLARCRPEDVAGGDAAANARIAMDVLGGRKGPPRDLVLLNGGAVIHVAGVADSIAAGVRRAAEAIDSGRGMAKLEQLRRLSQEA